MNSTTAARVLILPLVAACCLTLAGCGNPSQEVVSLDVYRLRLAALRDRDFFQTTRIVDRHGQLLAEVAPHGRRTWTSIDGIPEWLQQAVIATEDKTFRDNAGVDTAAVGRALLQNAEAGSTVSGASTITMQLVRMVAFEPEERFGTSLDRKVREAHLAAEIAEQYSKDEILEDYLNVAFFGNRAYGIEAAANTYFGRSARELTVAQATLLAGLLQAPAHLDPYRNLAGAVGRQGVVLDLMVNAGYLSREEADLVKSAPLELVAPEPSPPRRAEHFVDYLLATLPDLIGTELAARGGFTVTTTLDLALNERLTALAAEHVAALRSAHDVTDAAVVVVRPGSGEILAMIGGVNYYEPESGQVNLAVVPRQSGSAFKPITYAAALDSGWTAAGLVWDVPWSFPIGDGTAYQPQNYDGRYQGPVRIRQALGNSLNAAAVHLLAEVGVARVHDLGMRMGLALDPDPWHYGLSLTLGGAEVPLLGLTGAFAALANGGSYVAPTPVLFIEPLAGGPPMFTLAPQPNQVVSAETAWLISDILSDADARRPAFAANGPLELTRPAAVKTGTTNDFRDNVTVGYTPYLAVGVWTGNKDGHPMRDVLGITGAAPIWHDVMETVFADPAILRLLGGGQVPADGFRPPPTIVGAPVCDLRTLTTDGRCRTYLERFSAGSRFEDAGWVYDWAALRSSRPATSGDDLCAVRGGAGTGDSQVFLAAPRDQDLAAQVRAWAAQHGVRVMPPACDGLAASAGSQADSTAARMP